MGSECKKEEKEEVREGRVYDSKTRTHLKPIALHAFIYPTSNQARN